MHRSEREQPEFPRLARNPIVEAVIQYIAKPGLELSPEEWRREVQLRLPDHEILPMSEVGVTFSSHHAELTSKSLTGFRLSRQNHKVFCLIRPEGIVCSRLKPYLNWDDLCAEAKKYWEVYRQIASPVVVEGLRTRYINRFTPLEDLSQSINEAFEVYNTEKYFSESFLRIDEFRTRNQSHSIRLARSFEQDRHSRQRLLVDISVKTGPREISFESIATELEQLRRLKNEIFFDYVLQREFSLPGDGHENA